MVLTVKNVCLFYIITLPGGKGSVQNMYTVCKLYKSNREIIFLNVVLVITALTHLAPFVQVMDNIIFLLFGQAYGGS